MPIAPQHGQGLGNVPGLCPFARVEGGARSNDRVARRSGRWPTPQANRDQRRRAARGFARRLASRSVSRSIPRAPPEASGEHAERVGAVDVVDYEADRQGTWPPTDSPRPRWLQMSAGTRAGLLGMPSDRLVIRLPVRQRFGPRVAHVRSVTRPNLPITRIRDAPGVGLEPTTYGLTVRRSAN